MTILFFWVRLRSHFYLLPLVSLSAPHSLECRFIAIKEHNCQVKGCFQNEPFPGKADSDGFHFLSSARQTPPQRRCFIESAPVSKHPQTSEKNRKRATLTWAKRLISGRKKAWRNSLQSGQQAVYLRCSLDLPTAGVLEQLWSLRSKSRSLWQRGMLMTLWGFRLISNFLICFKGVLPGFEQWQGEREQTSPHDMKCGCGPHRPIGLITSQKSICDLTNKNKCPLLSVGLLPESYLGKSA